MAGVVEDGGTITHAGGTTTSSFGRNDVFVAQFQTDSGNVNWLEQLGTSKDDRVASIQILKSSTGGGGLLLFGDSSGSLLASASKSNEVWIAQIPMDGTLPITTETSSEQNNDGGNVPIGQPVYDDGEQIIPPDDPPSSPNTPSDGIDNSGGPSNPTPIMDSSSDDDGDDDRRSPLLVSIIVVLIIFAIGVIIVRRKQIQQERITERALVFSYLQAFEPEEIDVRNSATGGWHGTYVGKLHQGGAASHSSAARDNTFVDYDLGSPVEPNRAPRRKFVIGDDDDADEDMELDGHGDDEYRNRYKADDDYEDERRDLDAVDVRIGDGIQKDGVDDEDEDKPAWGKEIV